MYQPNAEHNTFCYRQLFEYAIEGKSKKLQKIFERDGNIPVDITNSKGQTLLYVSCLYQRYKVVVLLLQFGADPNHRSADGSTPTHAAAYSCSSETLRCIVEEYGGDMRLHDKQMQTPRDWALRAGKNLNKKILKLIEIWQDQVDKKMHTRGKVQRGVGKVTRSEELLKSSLKIDYCGYGTLLHSSRSNSGGYFGFAAVVPLASPTHITSPGNLSLLFSIPPSFVMEEALWCHYRVMIKRGKGKSFTLSRASEDLLIAEAKACRLVRHPNLLLLMAICITSPEESYGGMTDHWLVYEYVGFGSLFHVLHKTNRNLLPTECAKIMIQVADALWFVHQRGFIHCAISSHAIYLSHGLVAKLGNMSCVTSRGNSASIHDVAAILPHFTRWVAPEVILKDAITTKTDVYGFCVVVCEIFSGSLPWYGCDNVKIEEHIKKRRNYFMLPDWLPAPLIEMLQNGLKFYSQNRIVNICDLQGCMASLLENGGFDKMVSCLNAGEIPKSNDFNFDSATGDVIHDYVPSNLYSHIMSGGNIGRTQKNSNYFPSHAGEDVPDAKPITGNAIFLVHEGDKDNASNKRLSVSDPFMGPDVKIASNFGESKLIEVAVDVHNEQKHESAEEFAENEVGNFVASKETSARMLTLKYPELMVNPLQRKRPHSCSILTQDGLAREFLPTTRHNSYPDVTSDMRPPSYASALGSRNRHNNDVCIKNNSPPTPLISITGPPDKVYSPRSVPISLSDLSKNTTSPANSSKGTSDDKKKRGKNPDLSSSFATYTTIDHLSMPYSLTSNIYPSSSERPTELSKESDTPSTSVKISGKDTKHARSSESTDMPDSSFVVENVPPPEYGQLENMVNVGCGEDLKASQQNVRTSNQNCKVSEAKSDVTSQRIPHKATASPKKVSRTTSYTRDRKYMSNSKRTRWSTSALVERRRVNNAEFSAEEMYNIGHDDLEFIFESFAERKNTNNSSDSTSVSPVHYTCPVKQSLFTDKASQTELQGLSSFAQHLDDEWLDDTADAARNPCNVVGKGDESCSRMTHSVYTNTESNSRPPSAGRTSPFFIRESTSRRASPCQENCTKYDSSMVDPKSEVFTHCKLQGKPPPGNQSAFYYQALTADTKPKEGIMHSVVCGAESQNMASMGITAEDNDTPSSEYLYSQEFLIPAHAEEYTSSYNVPYEDLEDTNYGSLSESDSPGGQVHLEGHFSSLKISEEPDTCCNSFKATESNRSDTNFNIQQMAVPDESEQFTTCIEGEDHQLEQDLIKGSEVITERTMIVRDRDCQSVVESNEHYLMQSRKPGESGESVTEMEKLASPKKIFPEKASKQGEVNVVSQTPSKWSFQKKLCLFKVVADNGNGSNLEKRVLTQNAFSKVRQTAEMFENLTPPPSPRGAVPERVTSPPPYVTEDTSSSSTPNSSKFLQEHVGQIFDASTPVSVDPPMHDIRVKCKHPISPRTFEEVRKDIESSSVQKCHLTNGNNTTCTHEHSSTDTNTKGENDDKQTVGITVVPYEASTTFYTDNNSYEELMINPPATDIRQMVQGLLSDMIQNAISTLDKAIINEDSDTDLELSADEDDADYQSSSDESNAKPSNEWDVSPNEELNVKSNSVLVDKPCSSKVEVQYCDELQVNSDKELDINSNDESEVVSGNDVHRNPVRLSKSVPSINRLGAIETHRPRMTQSVSDIDSLVADASGDRVAQECSSYVSDLDEHHQGSNCYRSVDTSIWSL